MSVTDWFSDKTEYWDAIASKNMENFKCGRETSILSQNIGELSLWWYDEDDDVKDAAIDGCQG